MRISTRLLLVVACGLVIATAAVGAQRPRGLQTIDTADIRPGMRGYGLTVFRGTRPERFDVEVIDVLHNFRPDMDIILVRTPHPLLDRAIAVGGMSGSPIYLEGKLAGAYAYGWPFGQEPVIGVTPIDAMLAEMDRPVRPDSFPGARPLQALAPERPRDSRRAPGPAYRGGTVDAFSALRTHASRLPASAPAGLRPAATPLMLGGFTDEVAHLLADELEPFGIMALQGGGSGNDDRPTDAPPRFVDGGPLGVQLVRGDISATAIGTVTHVGRGQRLIGFGHPMMNAGEIGLPTATARVVHIITSLARSFKLAEAQAPLGTLIHDRQSAVVVDTGVRAATVPLRLRLHGLVDVPREEWNVEIASHRLLTPVLAFGAMANAIKATASDQTDVMYTARYTVELAGHGPVTLEDRGYMGAGPADMRAIAGLRLFELMEVAYGNPFETLRVESIDVELSLRFARDVLVVEEISTAEAEVDPGGTVDVRVRLRQYGRPDVERTVAVRIPESAAGKTVEVKIEAGDGVRPERPVPRNVDDLLRIVRDRYPATSFVTSLKLPSRGLRFRGHVVRGLPRSTFNALQRVTGTGPSRPFVTYLRRAEDVGEIVAGSATLSLRVRETPREER